ncbi:cyclopropane-fatty-acyl-phospholipid synthase family protein [Neorhizobium sp. T6_25]|uniref:SAM-dependent methyltransferase n=1 Tax=Neorhizobium sp. T6_25 TaxID=2093833 RepID=UPI000CF91FD4|nr:cyclopropane-fatty-acyl-phospholipid synthase family protein [Neorhizobium sp. T6_25]
MNMLALAINTAERTPLTDGMTLAGIDFLCGRTKRKLAAVSIAEEQAFAETMAHFPVATHTHEANRQHYEVPAEFFALALGPQRKYSCCLYPTPDTRIEEAETYALTETVKHAAIEDGMSILDLGCGWGSLSLHLAQQFPRSRITSVSNSASQRTYILDLADKRGLTNLIVITADMNDFSTDERFDRVVSVEMFEHMSNWRTLLERVRGWVKPDGKFFLHIFTHKNRSYRFDHDDPTDWIAHHFFTGGIMPAHDLPHRFGDLFGVEQEWRWPGTHYRRTALDWLAAFDRNIDRIQPIFRQVYGKDTSLWQRRWRLFFLATAGLFGHDNGDVWGVGHYLLSPTPTHQRT